VTCITSKKNLVLVTQVYQLWERRIGPLHAAVAALKLQHLERILVAVAVAARETRDEFKNEQQIISSCE
jgi:hypothetical protein